MANENRLNILISLLTGEKRFEDLKDEIDLKKTALSNHLKLLLENHLIIRPNYGIYQITKDGENFLKEIENCYSQSSIKEKVKI